MTPTLSTIRRARPRSRFASPMLLAALILPAGAGLTGCGYNARDAHLAQRGVLVTPSEGDGSVVVVRPDDWAPLDAPTTAVVTAGDRLLGGVAVEPTN